MRRIIRFFNLLVWLSGLVFLSLLYIAGTNVPWNWYRWMAMSGDGAPPPPDYIIMMGGGGIPSKSGLTRSWKAAEAATLYPSAGVIVALPLEANESTAYGIEHELQIRGVEASRIQREPSGRNTREQAVEVYKLLQKNGNPSAYTIGLVTSPEHMRRTWRSFERAGFTNVISMPSWSEAITADLRYDEAELGDRSLGGAVGQNVSLRYRYWDNLGILVDCTREVFALVYYRMLGWI